MNYKLTIQDSPIFVSGHIKSGTSLMISLLDGHSDLFAFPEELFFFNKLDFLQKKKKEKVQDFWDVFFSDIQIKRFFKGEQSGLYGNVDYSNFDGEAFEKSCRSGLNGQLNIRGNEKEIFELIFSSFQQISNLPSNLKWVEKTPTNESNFKTWLSWYPTCKFIYLKRDPFEVFAAIKKKRQKEKVNYPISHFIENYKKSLRLAVEHEKNYPSNFRIVRFQELIANQKEEMNQICQFLNISFEPILLKPTKNGVEWLGNSMFRENHSHEIKADDLREKRLSFLTEKEKEMISDLIVENHFAIKSNLLFLKEDWKRFLKTQFPKIFNS